MNQQMNLEEVQIRFTKPERQESNTYKKAKHTGKKRLNKKGIFALTLAVTVVFSSAGLGYWIAVNTDAFPHLRVSNKINEFRTAVVTLINVAQNRNASREKFLNTEDDMIELKIPNEFDGKDLIKIPMSEYLDYSEEENLKMSSNETTNLNYTETVIDSSYNNDSIKIEMQSGIRTEKENDQYNVARNILNEYKESGLADYEKIANSYGIDPEYFACHLIQEYGFEDGNIGQIEKSEWDGKTINIFKDGKWQDLTIDFKYISNPEYNMNVAAAILQYEFNNHNWNIALGSTAYNLGSTALRTKVFSKYTAATGKTLDDVKNDPSIVDFLDPKYTYISGWGDANYLKRMMRWADKNMFVFTKPNGEEIKIEFVNPLNLNIVEDFEQGKIL